MEVNLLSRLRQELPQFLQAEFADDSDLLDNRNLVVTYGDTREDGGHMGAKLQFGNRATLEAVAKAIAEVGVQPAIAEDMQRRLEGKPSVVEPDPDDVGLDTLEYVGEPARQIRRTIGEVATGAHRHIDGSLVRDMRVLHETTLNLNEQPHDLDAQLAAFFDEQSVYETEMRRVQDQHFDR